MAEDKSDYEICSAAYGKTGCKVLYVARNGKKHTPKEFEVDTRMKLSTRDDYLTGDNRAIVGTDTQRNVVQVLAKKYGITNPEEFGLLVTQFLLDKYSHALEASITIVEKPWDRIPIDGALHNHAFILNPSMERWATITVNRKDPPLIKSGLRGLRILKTTKSAFKDFHSCEYRTLKDTDDRIFSTIVAAEWIYSSHIGVDFDRSWNTVKDSILYQFAGPAEDGRLSNSVQHTLYLSCGRVLENVPQISKIQIDLPNKHYYVVDMSPYPKDMVGFGENKTVYLPTEKPSGLIHAIVERKQLSKL